MLKVHSIPVSGSWPAFHHRPRDERRPRVDEAEIALGRHRRDVLDANQRHATYIRYVRDGRPGILNLW